MRKDLVNRSVSERQVLQNVGDHGKSGQAGAAVEVRYPGWGFVPLPISIFTGFTKESIIVFCKTPRPVGQASAYPKG